MLEWTTKEDMKSLYLEICTKNINNYPDSQSKLGVVV